MSHDRDEIGADRTTGAQIQQAFEDCLRLRELAERQTLRVRDNRDLAAIADRLHALAVSRTDIRYSEAAPDDTRTGLAWTCPHGVTYSGSMDFCSGARNAHDELEGAKP